MAYGQLAQYIPVALAGFGLFLVGGIDLLLTGRRLAVRIAAALATVAVTLLCASTLNQAGATATVARVLALGLLPWALLAYGRFFDVVAVLGRQLRRPAVRAALLALGGIGLALGSMLAFERGETAKAEAETAELDVLHPNVTVESTRESARTDHGHRIALKEPATPRAGAEWTAGEQRYLRDPQYLGQIIFRGGGTDRTNCHGWVFAGGRYLLAPEDVELILRQNNYRETPTPRPGDLVVYWRNGSIAHSGVVRYVTDGQPILVESKWGVMGVFLHPVEKSLYGTDYTFHCSPRRGHLLVGLAPAAAEPAE